MDLGNIIYIIAIIGYFIYQMTRKKGGQEVKEAPEDNSTPRQKPVSFEDLMKEIRNTQRPESTPIPAPTRPVASIPKERKISRTYSEVEQDEETRYYEDSYESANKKTYQASRQIHTIPSFPLKKIDYDALTATKANRYGEMLRNPKTVREAVILSEILKRKHFWPDSKIRQAVLGIVFLLLIQLSQ